MSTNSTENFAQFRLLVLHDLSLQEKLRELKDRREFFAKVIELGAGNGLVFTDEDIEEAMRESQRLWIERWI